MIFKNSIGRDLDTDEDTGKQQEKTCAKNSAYLILRVESNAIIKNCLL